MSIKPTPRTGFVRAIAQRAAAHPRIEAAIQSAVSDAFARIRLVLPDVLDELVREHAHGEQLRIYMRKTDREQQAARMQRIEADLSAGEAHSIIAKREKVTERYVRKIRGRLIKAPGTLTP